MPKRLPGSDESYLVQLVHWTSGPGLTIEEAARKIGISRSKAQSLLSWGREHGLIRTSVLVDRMPQDDLAERVLIACQPYGIEDVVVLPGPAEDLELFNRAHYLAFLRQHLGGLAAAYLEKLSLKPYDHICVGGGRTMMAFAQAYSPPMRQLVLRPLAIGGRWRALMHADAAAVLQLLLWRLGYRQWVKPEERIRVICPEVPLGLVANVRKQPEVQPLFGKDGKGGRDVDPPAVTLTAIGWRRYIRNGGDNAPGPHPFTSSFVQIAAESLHYDAVAKDVVKRPEILQEPLPNRVYRSMNARLYDRGVVVEVNRHAMDRFGAVQEGFVEKRCLAIQPSTLKGWKDAGTKSVVVIGSSRMVHALRAALLAGCFNVLIIDTALAVQLLEDKQRPDLYRRIAKVPESPKEESWATASSARRPKGKRQ